MFAPWYESFKIAIRELLRHKMRSFLTTVGIIMGVMAVIVTVSVTQGARGNLEKDIKKQGRNMIIIQAGSSTRAGLRGGAGSLTSLTIDDARAIEEEFDTVSRTSALQQFAAQAVTETTNWRVPVTGITDGYNDIREWPASEGRLLEPREIAMAEKVCVIGRTAARELFQQFEPLGRTVRIAGVPLKVVGVLEEKGVNPLGVDEDNCLIVPLNLLLRQIMGQERPAAIVASASSDDDVEFAVQDIQALLRQRHRLNWLDEDDFTVTTLKEKIELANALSNVMTLLLVAIALVSLLVGGVGIMNIMLVAVTERTREIGVRMAIGGSRRAINRQFLIEAVTISTAGGLLGVGVGVVLAQLVSSGFGWEPQLSMSLVLLAFGFSAGVGVVFGILPAKRAAALNPIEALRHD